MSFKSIELRDKFCYRFGTIVFLLFVLQLLTPKLAGQFFRTYYVDKINTVDLIDAVEWKGMSYIIIKQENINPGSDKHPQMGMQLFALKGNGKAVHLPLKIGSDLAKMLTDEQGLWFIYPDRYDFFNGTNVTSHKLTYPLKGDDPLAAIGDGSVYAIYSYEREYWLTTINEKSQTKPAKIPHIEKGKCLCVSTGSNSLLFYNGQLWHFATDGSRVLLQTIKDGVAGHWKEIATGAKMRNLASYDKKGIFLLREKYTFRGGDLLRFDNGNLSEPIELSLRDDFYSAKIVASKSGQAKVFYQGFGFPESIIRSFNVTEKGNDKPVKVLFFNTNPYLLPTLGSGLISSLVIILITLLMASSMIPGYRVPEGILEDGSQIQFASLPTRALAFFIDSVILSIPLVPQLWWLKKLLFDPEILFKTEFYRNYPILILGACFIIWIYLCLKYFAVLEGKRGQTVGKLVMGIRVIGQDGKPAGIKRAGLRTVLRIVDSFFNSIVGITFIAFTDNWQRLGDLAARTVVVKK